MDFYDFAPFWPWNFWRLLPSLLSRAGGAHGTLVGDCAVFCATGDLCGLCCIQNWFAQSHQAADRNDWCLSWGLGLSKDFLLIIIRQQDAYAKSRELNTLKYASGGQRKAPFIYLSAPNLPVSVSAVPKILMVI